MKNNGTATTYTAGPWKVVAEPWLFNGAPTICTATDGGMILGTVTHRDGNFNGQLGDPLADARLMAAAPDLLIACKQLLAAYDRERQRLPIGASSQAEALSAITLKRAARAAIAKAERAS